MHILAQLLLVALAGASMVDLITASIAPQIPAPAIVTAHSNQVVSRNYNRLYVPGAYVATTPTVYPLAVGGARYPTTAIATGTAFAYPGYYRYPTYSYSYYPAYGYNGYSTLLW